MKKAGLTGSSWPSPQQELLLRAALLGPGDAVPAWEEVRARLDIDRLEEGSYSLMPLIYRQLREAGVAEPLLPRLKGIYRHTWSKNQLLAQELDSVLSALRAADVEALVVGGAARIGYYAETGARTLSEFELLVREQDLEPALRALGWSAADGVPARVRRGRSTVRCSLPERAPFGLHWRFLPEYDAPGGHEGGEARLWQAARVGEFAGTSIRTLAPADELLDICAGGGRTARWANVQWVADAHVLVESADLDWDRFVQQAERYRAALRLREALTYLVRLLATPAPDEVLTRLEAFPSTRRDRLAHRVSSSGGTFLGEFPGTLARYIRSTPDVSPLRALLGLPAFLGDTWNVEGRWRLPVVATRKGVATLAARSGRRRRH